MSARVLRESLVRLERIPLVLRIPALPAFDYGTRVRLEIEKIDLFEAEGRARFVEALADAPEAVSAEMEPIEASAGALEGAGDAG